VEKPRKQDRRLALYYLAGWATNYAGNRSMPKQLQMAFKELHLELLNRAKKMERKTNTKVVKTIKGNSYGKKN